MIFHTYDLPDGQRTLPIHQDKKGLDIVLKSLYINMVKVSISSGSVIKHVCMMHRRSICIPFAKADLCKDTEGYFILVELISLRGIA